jgi:hypothetical protein
VREAQYTTKVRRGLPPDVYALKLSQRFGGGVADSWYSGFKDDLWIEYKWYESLPRDIDLCSGKNPKLSKLQQEWLRARNAEGRNVCVIVACANGAVIMPGNSWEVPITRSAFLERAVTLREVVNYIVEACSVPQGKRN